MCGRIVNAETFSQLKILYEIASTPINYDAAYNGAPTQSFPVVRYDAEAKGRSLSLLRWGLVPAWAKDLKIGAQCINARADTVAEKNSFKNAFKSRRCIVPATAFYEWQKLDAKAKQPYAIALNDGPMSFAGLWESWKSPEGETVRTFAILTTDANELMAPIHDRMPCILDKQDWPMWLGEAPTTPEALLPLLRPYPADKMKAWKVGAAVGNVRNQGAQLLEPMDG